MANGRDEEQKSTAYEGWAIVDFFGHTRSAGRVSEARQYGTTMLRLEVPEVDGRAGFTKFHGGSSIFEITPTTEDVVMRWLRMAKPMPIKPWELGAHQPALPAVSEGIEVKPRDERGTDEPDED